MSDFETLPARTGKSVKALLEIEPDNTLTITSRTEHGYRSAHRDYAARYFGKLPTAVCRVSSLNSSGVRVTSTRWSA